MSDEDSTMMANDVFVVTVTDDGSVRLAITTPTSEIELDMPHVSALWLGNELVRAFERLDVDGNGDARERWDPSSSEGGHVCARCGIPVESGPCSEHQPFAHAAVTT